MNNLDNFLNAVFGKKKNSVEPDDSFVTYLGNKLKYEFEKNYAKGSDPKPYRRWSLWIPIPAVTLALILAVFLFGKTQPPVTVSSQISETEKELAQIESETKELEQLLTEANIDEIFN